MATKPGSLPTLPDSYSWKRCNVLAAFGGGLGGGFGAGEFSCSQVLNQAVFLMMPAILSSDSSGLGRKCPNSCSGFERVQRGSERSRNLRMRWDDYLVACVLFDDLGEEWIVFDNAAREDHGIGEGVHFNNPFYN
jgi:hypothetical protein